MGAGHEAPGYRQSRKKNGKSMQLHAIVMAVALLQSGSADDPKLVYVRKATRQETIDATLAATGLPKLPGNWWYIGPFDNADGQGFETAYAPEREINLAKTYPGRDSEPLRWREARQFMDGAVNNLNVYPQNEYTC